MGRDTIQLEDVVSTISGEYLREFTSKYGILEGLHPELPGPEDTIVDFLEGKVGVYTKFFEFINYRIPISQFLFDILGYYQIHLSQLSVIGATKVSHFEITCRVLNIIPALSLFCVFYIPSYYSGWMSFNKRQGKNTPKCYTKPLDSLKNWNNRFFWVDKKVFPTVMAWRTGALKDEMPSADSYSALDVATLNTSRTPFQKQPELLLCRSRALAVASQEVPAAENTVIMEVISELNLEKETTAKEPPVNKRRRKRYQSVVEGNAPPKVLRKDNASVHPAQDTRRGKSPAAIGLGPESPSHTIVQQSVSNPDPLSSSKIAAVVADPDSENTSFTSMAGSPGSIYQPGWDVTNGCRLDTPGACQDLVDHIALSGQVAMVSTTLRFEQEAKLLKKSVAQVAHQDQRIQARENEIKNLEALLEVKADMKKDAEAKNAEIAQVTGEERIKAAFEEFKKYEDNKVEQRCAEMDARLDKLSVDFDEELYPHMLTAIAGRRWVIGQGMRLVVMKCAESLEIRRAFADVVSTGLAKGISEGLGYRIEYGNAGHDLVDVEAYDPEANSKFFKALQDLKDLKYLMVDELERLKDAPVELIMTSLHLESDTREDAPQWIRDLPNKSCAEKKKKCRVICRTHRIGFAHHPRSDGIPVSAPTVVPQGLAILVADAATQTEAANKEEEPHLRPQRSMSLPPAYHL
ncbi:hypothetical protein Tco_0120819 [Tanacetum coccineum]